MHDALGIDGGGCFGFAPAEVLRRSARLRWDAYAGTSIGSVIVMALALGLVDRVNADWFKKWMPQVFAPPSVWRRLNPRASQYDDAGLNMALQAAFGVRKFSECQAPTFITAVDVDRATLKVFDSTDPADGALLAWEVCRRATAAETYFPAWKGFADGGILANNPSMVLLAACAKRLDWPLATINLVSLGCGISAYEPTLDISPSGELTTAAWCVDVLMHGCSDCMSEYFVSSLSPMLGNYLRVQFQRGAKDNGWRMDNPDVIELAEATWDKDIDAAALAVGKS